MEVKRVQDSPKRKKVLKQISTLPNVFFIDALLMLYNSLDKTESRIIQTPTVNEYRRAICEKDSYNPFTNRLTYNSDGPCDETSKSGTFVLNK